MRASSLTFYFFFFSFMDWIADTIIRSFLAHAYTTGSFFPIPLCPVYGFGALLILFLHRLFASASILTQWTVYGISLGALEFVTGEFISTFFHRDLWSYSSGLIPLGHFTDLVHVMLWGALGLIFVRYIEPYMFARLRLR